MPTGDDLFLVQDQADSANPDLLATVGRDAYMDMLLQDGPMPVEDPYMLPQFLPWSPANEAAAAAAASQSVPTPSFLWPLPIVPNEGEHLQDAQPGLGGVLSPAILVDTQATRERE